MYGAWIDLYSSSSPYIEKCTRKRYQN